ncbi:hypothetical protein IQ07DRAFT_582716 [Pyrenochaeta sp. DS3sAY3a]|nr:hypothetical protein IQ07DRAFT_582716 [Pyrenochaeta sp. DS3sAY3a]
MNRSKLKIGGGGSTRLVRCYSVPSIWCHGRQRRHELVVGKSRVDAVCPRLHVPYTLSIFAHKPRSAEIICRLVQTWNTSPCSVRWSEGFAYFNALLREVLWMHPAFSGFGRGADNVKLKLFMCCLVRMSCPAAASRRDTEVYEMYAQRVDLDWITKCRYGSLEGRCILPKA